MSSQKRSKDKRRRQRRQQRSSTYKAAKKETFEAGGSATPSHSDTIMPTMMKQLNCKVAKVNSDLGLVFGWAIVCTEGGEPYIDLHNDHIPDHAMLKAATKFAKGARIGGDMHRCESGTVIHTMPLTAEIAKAFGIECDKTGMMIAMQPDTPEGLEKFRTGERTGFSIGGARIKDTSVTVELE